LFRKETNLADISIDDTQQTDSEVTSVLSAYKSEGDPAQYEKAYSELKKFVEGALDIYKVS
jgi:transcription initiation factor TFIID subunit 5